MSGRKKVLLREAASKVVEGQKDVASNTKIIAETGSFIEKTERACSGEKKDWKELSAAKAKEVRGLTKALGLLKQVQMPAAASAATKKVVK